MPDIPYRVGDLERRLLKVEDRLEDVPVLRNDTNHNSNAIHELADEVKALRRALYTAALSFAIGALSIAISVLFALR